MIHLAEQVRHRCRVASHCVSKNMRLRKLVLLWALAAPAVAWSQTVSTVASGGNLHYAGAGITTWGNGDIGAQINAAYAALPARGGTIVVIAPANGACYSFMTPIVAAVPGKYLLLQGGALASQVTRPSVPVCLNFTQTNSSAAMTVDYVFPGETASIATHGIQNLTLVNNQCETMGGCGSNATGISFGGGNGGAAGATFTGLKIVGFGTGLGVGGSSSRSGNLTFRDCVISYNTTGFLDTDSDGGHFSFDACHFQGNATAVSSTASLRISNSWMESNTVLGVNCLSPAACDINSDHFENAEADSTHFLAGNGVFSVLGGDMRDDHTTGNTDWWMNFAGTSFFILGTVLTSGGRTTAHVILYERKGTAIVQNSSPSFLAMPDTQQFLTTSYGSGSQEATLMKQESFTSAGYPASGSVRAANDVPNRAFDVSRTGSESYNYSGTFSNTQMNQPFKVVLNGLDFKTELDSQGVIQLTDSLAAGVKIPRTATVFQADGISGWTDNASTTTNAVAGFFPARCVAPGSRCWGLNPVVSDYGPGGLLTSGFAATINGIEVDLNCNNPRSTCQGVVVQGGSHASPTVSNAFRVAPIGPNQKWSAGFGSDDGVSNMGLGLGAQDTKANSFSQQISLTGRDTRNMQRAATIQATPTGGLNVNAARGQAFGVNLGTGTPRTRQEIGATLSVPDALHLNTSAGHLLLSDGGNVGVVFGVYPAGGSTSFGTWIQARNNLGINNTAYDLYLEPLGGLVHVGVAGLVIPGSVGGSATVIAPDRGGVRSTLPRFPGTLTVSIASGTVSLGVTAIPPNACAPTVTSAAAGVVTTDVISWNFSADPDGIKGYRPSPSGTLSVSAFPTTDKVAFHVCNFTSQTVIPDKASVNWQVMR